MSSAFAILSNQSAEFHICSPYIIGTLQLTLQLCTSSALQVWLSFGITEELHIIQQNLIISACLHHRHFAEDSTALHIGKGSLNIIDDWLHVPKFKWQCKTSASNLQINTGVHLKSRSSPNYCKPSPCRRSNNIGSYGS